jgi:hypothetical protein
VTKQNTIEAIEANNIKIFITFDLLNLLNVIILAMDRNNRTISLEMMNLRISFIDEIRKYS